MVINFGNNRNLLLLFKIHPFENFTSTGLYIPHFERHTTLFVYMCIYTFDSCGQNLTLHDFINTNLQHSKNMKNFPFYFLFCSYKKNLM